MTSRLSQAARVLERLKQGPASSWELGPELGVLRLSARIMELRALGHTITWTEKFDKGRRIVTYTLEGHSLQVPAIEQQPTAIALQRSETSKEPICANPACGKAFEPDRKTQRFCSRACRWADWDRRNPRLNFPQPQTRFPQDLPLTARNNTG